jgi:hypothetical protein
MNLYKMHGHPIIKIDKFMFRRILESVCLKYRLCTEPVQLWASVNCVVWLELVKPSTFTVTHSPEQEHNPKHDYPACTKRIIACSADSVQGLDGQRLLPAKLIPFLADHLSGLISPVFSR